MAAMARTFRSSKFLISALAAAISAVTGNVYAQDDGTLEEITVTGSRIRQTSGFTTPVPVTSLSTTELFDLAPGSSVAEQLDALPQFFGNRSLEGISTVTVSTSGSTNLDLRNLSGNRTLVLFDGYRVVPSSKEGTVNVDFFPTALVRSVDVVTGGASAAYGADAVGGVTNFVVDREFEGLKINASTGINEFGDGERWNFSIAGGRQFGERLNVIGSLEAIKIDGFQRTADEVPEMRRVGWVTNPAWRRSDPPGTNPQRLTLPNVGTTANSPYGLILGTRTALDGHRFTPDGQNIVPFNYGDIASVSGPGSTSSMSGGTDAAIYNDSFGGGIGATQGDSRSGFLGLQYQVSDSLSVFGQALVGRTKGSDVLDRGGLLLFSIWAPRIAVDNAFLPEHIREFMVANNLSEFQLHKNGSIKGDLEPGYGTENSKVIDTASYSLGFDLDLPFRDWHVRGVYQTGESERRNIFGANWRVDRYFLGMDAVRDPATGAIVCRVQLVNPTLEQLAASPAIQGRISSRSTLGAVNPGDPGAIPLTSPIGPDAIDSCVPFNVMGSGNMTQAALDYIHGPSPKIAEGVVDQDFAEILLTGELYEGFGAGPLSFAAGLTWRDQSFQDLTYPIDIDLLGPPLNDPALGIRGIPPGYQGGSGNLHYNSSLPQVSGDASVWEWFSELNVPIWEGSMGNQEQRLDANLAFRQSDYERSGKVDSWKVGLDMQVLTDVRLRLTQSRDVREPTFAELFDSQGTNGSFEDPRANGVERQITGLRGGNPDLAPEEADTVTAGIVWTPSFSVLDGLQVSLDWYDVTIDGAVSLLGIQRIVDECFIRNVQSLCAQIEMNASGAVTRVKDAYLNVAQATVEGTDLEVVYRMEPDFFGAEFESFTLRALAGYVKERTNTPLGGSATDSSGTQGNPDLTAVVTANYSIGSWSFQLQNRFTDSVTRTGTWIEGVDVDDNSLPSISWWNGRLGYSSETATGAAWNVGLNVQNLFDKRPVIVPSVNTRFPIQSLTGDTYGRRYNLSVNYTF